MGKKGGRNKLAPAADTGTSTATAAAAAPAEDAAASWLDALSPEERRLAVSVGCSSPADFEREKARLQEKTKKAEEQQRQQLWQNEKQKRWEKEAEKAAREKGKQDRQWQQHLQNAIQTAKKQGVLEAEDWGDGTWWLKTSDKQYKEGRDKYFCPHCDKYLNDNTIKAHIDGNVHTKKLEWLLPGTGAAASPALGPAAAPGVLAPRAANGAGAAPPQQQRPQQAAPSSKKYPPPELPYLAWVPADDAQPNGERWLRCLLCQKWVQDDASHSGTQRAPAGSKEHAKNLRNYGPGDSWYEANVTQERRKHHPEAAASSPTMSVSTAAASGRATAAATATPAPWSRQPASTVGSPPAAVPRLPPGWESGPAPGGEGIYYFNRETGESQWDPPMP